MADDKWLAKVYAEGNNLSIILGTDYVWRDEGEHGLLTRLLNVYTRPPAYSYSPADGHPGRLIAERLATKFKLRVEFPPGIVRDPQAEHALAAKIVEYVKQQRDKKKDSDKGSEDLVTREGIPSKLPEKVLGEGTAFEKWCAEHYAKGDRKGE